MTLSDDRNEADLGDEESELKSNATDDDTAVAQELPELDAFSPPKDFDHGEEFEPPTPRPIPKYLKTRSHARRKRGMIYSLIALGIMFVVFWPIPFVQGLSFYILPLKWLHWIGFGLIGIGIWTFFASIVSSGRFAYVKNGEPFVGRVLDCQKVVTGTEEVPTFQHVARVEYHHPESNQHVIQDFVEFDHWPASKLEKMSCQLERGDYVTLVRLPGKDDSANALYGFLGLDPEREFILKNGQPMRGTSPFNAIMVTFLIGFAVLLVMAAFDLMMFSFPVGGGWKLPLGLVVAGLVVGGVIGILFWSRSKSQEKSKTPIPSFLGVGFLGALSAPIGFFVLNANLDNAPSILKPVEIVEFWNTTHNFIIRDYELEYRSFPVGQPTKRHMRFSQMTNLYGSKYAVEEIKPGRFGYPWSSGIHPIYWMRPEETEIEQPVVEFEIDTELPEKGSPETEVVQMISVISLGEHRHATLPKKLLSPELENLKSQPMIHSVKVISQDAEENTAKNSKESGKPE